MTMIFDYDQPAKFALDKLRFSYRGEVFKGSGFLEWNLPDRSNASSAGLGVIG
jgi:hypothetical protein